jgi:hypothetical protein
MTTTSKDLDHRHSVALLHKVMRGGLSRVDLVSSSVSDLYVIDSDLFSDSTLQTNPTIVSGSKIFLYSKTYPDVVYSKEVIIMDASKISVKTGDINDWDFDGTNKFGIKAGFSWKLDVSHSGLASTVEYDGLVLFQTYLTSNTVIGSFTLEIEDSSSMISGDSIEIWDSRGVSENNTVNTIISPTEISVNNPLTIGFLVNKGGRVKVRRDSYPSSHSHLIKNGEIMGTAVDDLSDLGYEREHHHIISHKLPIVGSLLKEPDTGRVLCSGSGSTVYKSDDNGISWGSLVDLNTLNEGAQECSFVTSLSLDNSNGVICGADSGYIVSQTTSLVGENALVNPDTDEFMPSSSSSFSSLSSESSSSSDSSSNSSSSTSSSSSSV